MARSSRHKLHRSHKHRDRSLSDDEDNSKGRKQKAEEEDTVRSSRVSDQEKRKNSSKDVMLSSNGDVTSEHGKKRKDIGDRWNGGGDKDVRTEKEIKKDELDVKSEKISKGKYGGSVSKNRDDTSEKVEEKRRTDKEISSKDGKEPEKVRERGKLNGKEVEKKEKSAPREVEFNENAHSREVDREKRNKRRHESGDYDKADDKEKEKRNKRRHESGDHDKDGKTKEKYRDELDREYKRRREERSSRTHTSEKSDKHHRGETKISESHDKKSNFPDNEHKSSRYSENHTSKRNNDSRGRKKSSDEICDQSDMKNRSAAKEPRDDSVKYGSSSSRYDSRSVRVKVEQSDIEKAESSLNRPKNSPKSPYAAKDQKWEKSVKTESSQRESSPAVRERISEAASEKSKLKTNSRSDTSAPEPDRTTRSGSRTPQTHFPEKPPFTNPEDGGQNRNNSSTPVPHTPNHLPPPVPPGSRTNSSRYKRGPPTPWKGLAGPAWPSPVIGNGFMPMQHGPPLGFPHLAVPPFPPHQFRPPMDMINPPYGIHPYDMQLWDGGAGMYAEDPHMYGRVMMGNRGMWNGQNGNNNVGMDYGAAAAAAQKENEYSYDERVRSEKPPLHSDDGGSSKAVVQKEDGQSQLSVSVAEKTGDVSKTTAKAASEGKKDERVSYVGYYLSKIDISSDLACPDVYAQCMGLIEGKDGNNAAACPVSVGQRKNNLSGFIPVAKSRETLLPMPSDDIFQKCMSLYKAKVEGYMNVGKKGASVEAEASPMKGITEEEEEKDGADEENCDVEMSEKTENVVNPESDIIRILSSTTESTH